MRTAACGAAERAEVRRWARTLQAGSAGHTSFGPGEFEICSSPNALLVWELCAAAREASLRCPRVFDGPVRLAIFCGRLMS